MNMELQCLKILFFLVPLCLMFGYSIVADRRFCCCSHRIWFSSSFCSHCGFFDDFCGVVVTYILILCNCIAEHRNCVLWPTRCPSASDQTWGQIEWFTWLIQGDISQNFIDVETRLSNNTGSFLFLLKSPFLGNSTEIFEKFSDDVIDTCLKYLYLGLLVLVVSSLEVRMTSSVVKWW